MERDERLGLPSASGAAQWLLCPGSHLAQQGMPGETTPDAELGTRLHSIYEEWVSGFKLAAIPVPREQIGLTLDELDFLQQAAFLRNHVVQDHFTKRIAESKTASKRFIRIIEQRLSLEDPETGETVLTGRGDEMLLYRSKSRHTALVIDLKSGREAVEEARGNPQLATLAALLYEHTGRSLESIGVAIVQPYAESLYRFTYAVIKAADLERMIPKMIERAKQAMLPDQPRIPGRKQCKWCRFKTKCPEAGSVSLATIDSLKAIREDTVITEQLLDNLSLAGDYLQKGRGEIHKRALEQLETIPGSLGKWERSPGKTTLTITNVLEAWRRLGEHIGSEAFSECCSASVDKLSTALAQKLKITKKAAREKIESELDDILERSHSGEFIFHK